LSSAPLGGWGGNRSTERNICPTGQNILSYKTEHSVFHPPRGERGEQKGSGRTQQPNLMGLGSQSEPTEERAPFCRVGFLVGNLRGNTPMTKKESSTKPLGDFRAVTGTLLPRGVAAFKSVIFG